MAACAAATALTVPPEGYNGYEFEGSAIAFIIIETCFVALRFFARFIARIPWSWDDALILLALVFNYGLCGVSIAMVERAGIGRHTLWLCIKDPMALILYAKLQIPFTILVAFAIGFGKLAILFLFLRIFVLTRYRYTTYALVAVQIATMLSVTIVTCLECTPISYLWEPQLHPAGHCIDINAFWRWGNFPQIVTDIAILVLPLPALLNLQLSRRDKIGVVLTFCTGGIGLVTSIVRFVLFYQIDGQTDGAWVASRLGAISIAEAGMYIIAGCLPAYRSLYLSVKKRTVSKVRSRTAYTPESSLALELKSKPSISVEHASGHSFEHLVSVNDRQQG